MLTKRDQEILDFLSTFKCATTKQIEKIFFNKLKQSGNIARRRMLRLYEAGLVKRERYTINMDYIYYLKKSSQMAHQMLIVDFYIHLLQFGAEIESYSIEKEMDFIRPDGLFICAYKDFLFTFALEVQISNNPIDQDKYERFYNTKIYEKYLEDFPRIIVVSDKKIKFKKTQLTFIQCSTDYSNFKDIFKV